MSPTKSFGFLNRAAEFDPYPKPEPPMAIRLPERIQPEDQKYRKPAKKRRETGWASPWPQAVAERRGNRRSLMRNALPKAAPKRRWASDYILALENAQDNGNQLVN